MRIDKPAKIFIFRQEYPALGESKIYNPFINCTRLYQSNLKNVISRVTKGFDQCNVTALIREEPHAEVTSL